MASELETNCRSIVDIILSIDGTAEIPSKDAMRCLDTTYNLDLMSIGMYEIEQSRYEQIAIFDFYLSDVGTDKMNF